MDFGEFPNAAIDIATRMLSRQNIQFNAGDVNASFDLDNTNTRCQLLNEAAIRSAEQMADKAALSVYNTHGKKLTTGADIPYGDDPEWILHGLQMTDSAD